MRVTKGEAGHRILMVASVLVANTWGTQIIELYHEAFARAALGGTRTIGAQSDSFWDHGMGWKGRRFFN